ncbi:MULTISPECIES: aliphatic sulfonate ABC transporter substrate-binding protein [Methylobacterium]|uniref:Aliphatic sulfonates-binding protein n=1 Tax=Methylobacterium jeotgali TaxID=381630 RepID=A0ABQ4ST88_9HYPH|nr:MULTISPECIES: aliphatic sulfonate ABC transporter substrate-binding protein [Methylobacterium]PIU07452.1 MAG: sulfonate ABC transporter substrate-binding protein [Methylobacterium sp. CG09_land_8_20_14_0_10_71_15]PIU13988.1 MAG: sulfonate ABC transporter substrate-binding protein [Methylobacterium sp. CG08_land_8_20_14_0_20_71_15]GBU17312.1 aliphatic sulfonate ABC transporter periplasmic binding protein [Methylobacterium sp.]GJE05506.1 Putative aliphatic sulfonates-binding protein [Methyloba
MPATSRTLRRDAPALRLRRLLATWGALALLLGLCLAATVAHAQEKVIRVGYQKYGTLVLLKGKGLLEKKLAPLGYSVRWSEFPSGPPLLEALNAGAIDFGSAGETPPIFAQAASPGFVYVAAEPPAPRGEAILVPGDSAVRSLADLKGRTVAFNKGSNVHFLLVQALASAGVSYGDIKPAFLAPADGAAAFARGAVDAWVIWDPYLASGERIPGARTLASAEGLAPNRQFYLSARRFADGNREALNAVIAAVGELDDWARANTDAAAAELAPSVGIPAPVLAVALRRQSYGVAPLDAAAVADQQTIADTFHKLGLLPKPITVSDAVWKPGS